LSATTISGYRGDGDADLHNAARAGQDVTLIGLDDLYG
jgi:hypothetical protein